MDLSSNDLGKFQSQYHGGNIAFYKDFEREIFINIFVTCFDLYCPWLRNWIWQNVFFLLLLDVVHPFWRSFAPFCLWFFHESSYDGVSGTDNDEQSLNKSVSVFHLWLLGAFSWFQNGSILLVNASCKHRALIIEDELKNTYFADYCKPSYL